MEDHPRSYFRLVTNEWIPGLDVEITLSLEHVLLQLSTNICDQPEEHTILGSLWHYVNVLLLQRAHEACQSTSLGNPRS